MLNQNVSERLKRKAIAWIEGLIEAMSDNSLRKNRTLHKHKKFTIKQVYQLQPGNFFSHIPAKETRSNEVYELLGVGSIKNGKQLLDSKNVSTGKRRKASVPCDLFVRCWSEF